jgi:UDP-N-acetylglucosamine transferase subunit ALG13
LELLPLLARCDAFLVLNDEAPWLSADSLPEPPSLRRYRIVHAERDARQLVNLAEAAHLLLRERPDLLISTGASPAVPFFLLGRGLGIRTLFIEDFNLVEQPSLTARLVYPLSHHFFVQWPQLRAHFPRARYAGPLFVPGAAQSPTEAPTNSRLGADVPRLFVALGTSDRPMTRLLGWLDALIEQGAIEGPVLVQGSVGEYTPRHFHSVPVLKESELIANLRQAGRILCHGGCGVLGTCMKLGRRPIAIPRRADAGEAINDHQQMLCRALSDQGLATLCQTREELRVALTQPEQPPTLQTGAVDDLADAPSLHAAIAAILAEVAKEKGRRPPHAASLDGRPDGLLA